MCSNENCPWPLDLIRHADEIIGKSDVTKLVKAIAEDRKLKQPFLDDDGGHGDGTEKTLANQQHFNEKAWMTTNITSVKNKPTNNNSWYNCSICNRVFSSEKSLSQHLDTHSASVENKHENKDPVHKCSVCNAVFPTKTFLSRHVNFDHSGHGVTSTAPNQKKNDKPEHKCPICNAVLLCETFLSRHIDYVHKELLPGTKLAPRKKKSGGNSVHNNKRPISIFRAAQPGSQQATTKKFMNLETRKRKEGLQKSLDSSNKGFELLTKMGYKHGDGLGKSNTGIVEPLGIKVKNHRGGFGYPD